MALVFPPVFLSDDLTPCSFPCTNICFPCSTPKASWIIKRWSGPFTNWRSWRTRGRADQPAAAIALSLTRARPAMSAARCVGPEVHIILTCLRRLTLLFITPRPILLASRTLKRATRLSSATAVMSVCISNATALNRFQRDNGELKLVLCSQHDR